MQLIHEDKQKRTVKDREEISFSSYSSPHLVVITARARSEKQISKEATDDEDLVVRIDGKTFPKREKVKRLIDSPAAFSGGGLCNLAKTVYFLIFLRGKGHTIILEADKPHNTATFESLEIYTLTLDEVLSLKIEKQAEDGDRRPWLTFVLDGLPLKSITPTLTYSRRKRDSDDVKIIVDGKIQGNLLRTIKHFLWRFAGSLISRFSSITETETLIANLPRGLHYIEFDADRMPTLKLVKFDFGEIPAQPQSEGLQGYKDDRYNKYDREILKATVFWNQFFLKQRYPPSTPLDPNLVKAIVYVESRMGYGSSPTGYPAYPDVMQVGNPEDPALHVLRNDGKLPTESEAWSGKAERVDYGGKVKVETPYESIYWGTRWLYHKAQGINSEEKQIWFSWKEAVKGYGPGTEVYVNKVWNLYTNGADPDGGENLF